MLGLSPGSNTLGSGVTVRLIHRDGPPFTDDKLCRAWSFTPDERAAVIERAGFRLAEAKSEAEAQVTLPRHRAGIAPGTRRTAVDVPAAAAGTAQATGAALAVLREAASQIARSGPRL